MANYAGTAALFIALDMQLDPDQPSLFPNSSSNTVRRVSWKGLPRDADLPEILATDITRETSPARNTAGSACAWYALNVL